MSKILFNYNFISRKEAFVDIEDRGYQFGDGVYEVIRVYKEKAFMMNEHLERLQRSADEIGLVLPYDLEKMKNKMEKLLCINNLNEGIIYIQLTRGASPRTHGFPTPPIPPQLIAYTKKINKPIQEQQEGVEATLIEDIRWLRCDIKSLNLLGNVLAKQKAKDLGFYEAIQYRNNFVTEGSSTNVFIVKDDCLYTHPPTNLILNGITRTKVLELADNLEINVIQDAFSIEQLLDADEVFITSTTAEIMPIVKIDNHLISSGVSGPITIKLQDEFEK